ncbi:erythrose-4-phosphate dehydrogenase [Candidatus Endobugula sertula]|uniref:Erythrose-4-phosphate dehydrogenase n=1 Tax=Candidatus Endobugula sertula TaxID=62101 RepID=A0A1D2QSG0_9GAMM|nr:erythrose-4-phosphate dehydrogenase [Candidatus Endobugula sertula]
MRLAISGYGRVGRSVLRAIFEMRLEKQFQIVAINDLSDPALMCHLTQYDSTFGEFKYDVTYADGAMQIKDQSIPLLSISDATTLPWSDLSVDICFECSGHMTKRELAKQHLTAGARKVLVSQPCLGADKTIVYGVNHLQLSDKDLIVSNASCTTNCLAPLLSVLQKTIGVKSGMMTTIHAYTNNQHLIDKSQGDFYRSRSATQSIIPTRTGATKTISLIMPELEGQLHGMAIRAPIIDVSLIDLLIIPERCIPIEALHQYILQAANNELKGILAYNEKKRVSIDFKKHPASCIFDANHTAQVGNQLKLMSWYDNEWAFSLRMLDVAKIMTESLDKIQLNNSQS